jgi:hypothetical protein
MVSRVHVGAVLDQKPNRVEETVAGGFVKHAGGFVEPPGSIDVSAACEQELGHVQVLIHDREAEGV